MRAHVGIVSLVVYLSGLSPLPAVTVGPPFEMDGPLPGHNETMPAAAFNGSLHLVVWTDNRYHAMLGTSNDILGARVLASGFSIDPTPISIRMAAGVQQAPAVASDGTCFLVAWEERPAGSSSGNIFAARVNAAGGVLHPPAIPIWLGLGHDTSPAVAHGGGIYLVAFQSAGGIRGALVDPSGTVTEAGFLIGGAGGSNTRPAVAWNGSTFLVAWEDRRDGQVSPFLSDIYGARVDATGNVLDPDGIAISTAASYQLRPALAPLGDGWMVAWNDQRSTATGPDIYGTAVSGAGSVAEPEGVPICDAPGRQEDPSVSSQGQRLLVAWQDQRNPASAWDIYTAELDTSGAPILGERRVEGHSLDDTEPVVLAGLPDQFLVAYGTLRSGWKNVVGRRLTLDPGFRRGDSNADGFVDIADAVLLCNWLFNGGNGSPCHAAADTDDSGSIQITDPVRIFQFLFHGGSPPSYPGAFACGLDPTPDSLPVPCSYQACWPAPVSAHESFSMKVAAPATVSGPPGGTVRFLAQVQLCWDPGDLPFSVSAVQGWSFGVRVTDDLSIVDLTIAGTDTLLPVQSQWLVYDGAILPSGQEAVNATLLSLTKLLALPPTGRGCSRPDRLLWLTLEAPVLPYCYEAGLVELADGLQGAGEPVPIRVAASGSESGEAYSGRSFLPVVEPGQTVRICPATTLPNTPIGLNVAVAPGAGVQLEFEAVMASGYTHVKQTAYVPPISGWDILRDAAGKAAVYPIYTSAEYAGDVRVCIPYTGLVLGSHSPQSIRLLAQEAGTGAWRYVTDAVDTVNQTVCGTSRLAVFVLAVPRPFHPPWGG